MLGHLALDLGLYEEALASYERRLELTPAEGSKQSFLRALHTIAIARFLLAQEGREERSRVVEAFRRVVEEGGNTRIDAIAFSHCELAQLLDEPQSQKAHLRRCKELGKRLGPTEETRSWLTAADLKAETDPRAALGELAGALEAAGASPEPFLILQGWHAYLRIAWETLEPRQALEASLAVLDTVELLWSAQQGEAPEVEHANAALLGGWSEAFYWLAGRLLRLAAEDGSPWALEEAFRVTERMRGRLLLDDLHRAEVRQKSGEEGMAAATEIPPERILEETRRLHASLLAWAASGGEELPARPGPPEPLTGGLLAALGEVQGLLGEDEAFLSFQMINALDLYGRDTGSCWVVAVTRDGARVLQLPSASVLEGGLQIWQGALAAGKENPEQAAWLYDQLLAESLAALPEGIEHLILVPDGELHGLPFAALQASEVAPPLGTRYRLSVVPSATLWRRWRQSGAAPGSAALAFADPRPLPVADSQGKKLRPLPEARREARRVARRAGGASLTALGEEATEARFKDLDFEPYSVVHFATHTVVNHRAPYRSAVVLAPGGAPGRDAGGREGEDGLLQPAEIAALELPGRLVVLAACSSATGEVLRGEGVMGLARAFFAAGATTVVGTHWEVEDRASERFFNAFYEHLAAGRGASEALRRAQEQRWRAGDPTGAWAGYVVLGDGEARPLQPRNGGIFSLALSWWPAAVILLLLLTAVVLLAHRHSRRS